MPIICPKGTKPMYRYRKRLTEEGKRVRLGGCAKKGRFVSVQEIKVNGKIKRFKLKKHNPHLPSLFVGAFLGGVIGVHIGAKLSKKRKR